jgi:hypothetical protein
MNRDDIIRMAREADLLTTTEPNGYQVWIPENLERFAALVVAAERERIKWDSIHSCHPECDKPVCVAIRKAVLEEREACAKVCDDLPVPPYVPDNDAHIWDLTCVDCAFAIRERGAP